MGKYESNLIILQNVLSYKDLRFEALPCFHLCLSASLFVCRSKSIRPTFMSV